MRVYASLWMQVAQAKASQNAMNVGYIAAMQAEEEAIKAFKDFDPWKRPSYTSKRGEGSPILARPARRPRKGVPPSYAFVFPRVPGAIWPLFCPTDRVRFTLAVGNLLMRTSFTIKTCLPVLHILRWLE